MVKQIFNKKTKRGMAVLMAAAMVGTMSPVSLPTQPTWTAQAATTTKELSKTPTMVTASSINYSDETFTLDWDYDNEDFDEEEDLTDTVYYAIVTNKKFDGKTLNTFPKASAYEAVESEKMYDDIDLSWANLTKDKTYLFVTTDTDATKVKPAWVELAKQNTKLKISYSGTADAEKVKANTAIGDAENGYLIIDDKSNEDKVKFEQMEYRTEYGSDWKSVKTRLKSLERYIAKGATLQMRVKATETNPAGKTFKVKVTAKAKAPKVTVNYLNQTVKLAGGMEIATGSACDTTSGIDKWTPISKAEAKTPKKLTSDLYYNGSEPMKLFVRTAANGKKGPSKITVVKLGESVTVTPAAIATGTTISPKTEEGTISIDYKTSYKIDSGIQLTNNTDQPLQFAIVKKDAEALKDGVVPQSKVDALGIASTKDLKWTNVAAGKTTSKGFKGGTATISKIGKDKISAAHAADYMIIYRTANKKATVISQIAAAAFPIALNQEITAKTDKIASVKEVTVTTKSAVVTSELTLSRRVSDKSSYTVTIYEATTDQAGNYVPTTTKSSKITAKVDKSTGKLSIDGTKKATEGEKYIVTVKCEGAVLNILVTIGKETEVGASGTASTGGSTGGSGNENTVTFKSQSKTVPVTDKVFKLMDVSDASGYATVEVSADSSGYVITSEKPGKFSFTYKDNGDDRLEHTVNVTIAEDGSITTSES